MTTSNSGRTCPDDHPPEWIPGGIRMGLRDRFTRIEWTVLLLCLGLQMVNSVGGYYILGWVGVPQTLIVPTVVIAGGVFVLPILGIVVFTRPKDGRQASEYRYSIADFDDE